MSTSTPVQPRAGLWFFALPLIIIPSLVAGYAILLYLGYQGETAMGERVTMRFSTCAEAHDVLKARVDAMGLGEPEYATEGEDLAVTATLPANDSAARIPETLARSGEFSITEHDGEGIVLVGGVESATMRLDFIGEPSVAVQLTREAGKTLEDWMDGHREGEVTMRVDGEPMGNRANHPAERRGHLTIRMTDDDRAMQVERVAALAIVTNAPLPCTTSVR